MEYEFININDTDIEIIDGDRGKNYPKNHELLQKEHCVFLSTKNVTKNGFEFSECQFISKEKDEQLRKGKLKRNDIVLTTRGTVGNVGFYDNNITYDHIRINSGMIIIRSSQDYDGYFLYSYFQSPLFQHQTKQFRSGSAQPQLPIKDFKYIPIPKIDITEQKCISHFIKNLDSKINLLRRQNETLEQIAQTLFKRWFVDFEFPCLPENYKFSGARKPDDFEKYMTYRAVGGLPIPENNCWFLYVLLCNDGSFYIGITNDLYRRFYEHKTGAGAKWTNAHEPIKVLHWERIDTQKEAAERENWFKTGFGRKWLKREYKKSLGGSPAPKCQHQQTGSPAPKCQLRQAGEMVASEVGKIPKGRSVSNIGDEVKILGGGTPSTKESSYWESGNIIWYTPSDLTKDINLFSLSSERKITKIGLQNSSANLFPPYSLMMTSRATIGEIAINAEESCTNQGFIVLVPNEQFSIYYLHGWLLTQLKMIKILASGSTFPEISRSVFKKFNILKVPNEINLNFDSLIQPLYRKIEINIREYNNLVSIRDALLPKLMSGQIRVFK